VVGLILNGPAHADNPRTLSEIGDVPVLAELPPLHPLNAETLRHAWCNQGLGPKFEAFANHPNNR